MFQDGGPDSDHSTHEYSEHQKQIMIQRLGSANSFSHPVKSHGIKVLFDICGDL